MLKLIKKKTEPTVEFRESRGQACGALCRSTELIERQRERTLLRGWKLA